MDTPRNAPPVHARRAPADDGDALADHPVAVVEATLARVVASTTFRRSERHRRFLEHVVHAGLANERERLKEAVIGVAVFGRSATDFDPRRDPIVRVEAGRIRAKLARFYGDEGAGEAFRLVVPVGNYLPRLAFHAPGGASVEVGRLAVLPLAHPSGDLDDASFALALAERVNAALARVPGHAVVGLVSAQRARDAGIDLASIGKLLDVAHVVDGTLERDGTRLRCLAHLSRTVDGTRLWSERFELDAPDAEAVCDFQDLIASAVLDAVVVSRSPTGTRDARTRPDRWHFGTADRTARDLFERGRHLARQRSFDGCAQAIAFFERAVEIDPDFARAHAELAIAWASRHAFDTEPTFPAFANVERAALRASTIDPLDGEARALLATIAHRIDYRWSEAEPMFRDALRLAPHSAPVHASFAAALACHGLRDEALRHVRIAQTLDPLNHAVRADHAAIALYAGDDDLAMRECEAVLQVEPDHPVARVVLGLAHLAVGDPDAAVPHFEHLVRVAPDRAKPRFLRLCARALRGELDDARHGLTAFLRDVGDRHYSRIDCAMAQTCLGDVDDALASIVEAAEARDTSFVAIHVQPLFEPLRADPRFAAIVARYGIAPAAPGPVRAARRSGERAPPR